jgi:hypothetical protein
MSELGEPANDHAAMHCACQATSAPAQSSVLDSVDVAIALSQTLRSAEAVGRAVAHAELFEAEPAAWRIIDQPEVFASGSALRAAKIGPRAAVRELCTRDADELLFVTEGDDAMRVLKPIAPVALRRDTPTLTSSSKKMRRSASFPRFGMN